MVAGPPVPLLRVEGTSQAGRYTCKNANTEPYVRAVQARAGFPFISGRHLLDETQHGGASVVRADQLLQLVSREA